MQRYRYLCFVMIVFTVLTGCETQSRQPFAPVTPSATAGIRILGVTQVAPPAAAISPAVVPTVIPTLAPPLPASPVPTQVPPATPLPYDLIDALPFMQGICYESAYDARGRVFVIRSGAELEQLYDASDNSGLCRQPVTRYPLNLPDGAVMAGLWSYGTGCTANHDILNRQRNADTGTITLTIRFVTAGDCNYDLVRPFWVIILNAGSDAIVIERVP